MQKYRTNKLSTYRTRQYIEGKNIVYKTATKTKTNKKYNVKNKTNKNVISTLLFSTREIREY